MRREPQTAIAAALLGDYSRYVRTEEQVRRLFFTDRTPAEVVADCHRHLQNESAFALATMMVRPPRPARVQVPVTVVGARYDAVFTVDEQHRLAGAYGVEARILDGGHDLMLDTTWPDLVSEIDDAVRRV